MQQAKKELALTVAMALKRFPEDSAVGDKRAAAEKDYAEAMQAVGARLSDSVLIAMAAEAFMNLSPWDYYNVRTSPCAFPIDMPAHGQDLLCMLHSCLSSFRF